MTKPEKTPEESHADLRLLLARALVRKLGKAESLTLSRAELLAVLRIMASRPRKRPSHRPAGSTAGRDAAIWDEFGCHLFNPAKTRGWRTQAYEQIADLFGLDPDSVRRIVRRCERQVEANAPGLLKELGKKSG